MRIEENITGNNIEKSNDNYSPENIEDIRKEFEKYHHEKTGYSKEIFDNLKNAEADYDKVVENLEIEFSFEGNDKDISEKKIKDFINKRFNEDLLKIILIESFRIDLNTVEISLPKDNFLNLEEGHYFIPKEIFETSLSIFNNEEKEFIISNVFRAGSNANYFMDGDMEGKYLPTPIALYNQEYDLQNKGLTEGKNLKSLGLNYLSGITQEKIREMYILGSLAHEIGHHCFAYVIHINSLLEEWKEIIDKCGNITDYANKNEKEGIKDYDENFAEAIRIYTTCSDYLSKNGYEEVETFIEGNFEELIFKG